MIDDCNGWAPWRMDPGSVNSDVFAVMLGIDDRPRDGDVVIDRNGRRVVNLRRERCLVAGVPETRVDGLLVAVDRAGIDLDYVLHVLATSGQVSAERCPSVRFDPSQMSRAELFVRHEWSIAP